ncbi:hypothetical protein FQA47_001232 [Oryzias melastigma]|uniref:Uncharacterized protein n=1 Tax=Oryzias melastigma TaxID=30732 RepID=A0A834FNI5_ORYME|nr:hypothetical protein FQA47_001232 [Oryzias melastigma]
MRSEPTLPRPDPSPVPSLAGPRLPLRTACGSGSLPLVLFDLQAISNFLLSKGHKRKQLDQEKLEKEARAPGRAQNHASMAANSALVARTGGTLKATERSALMNSGDLFIHRSSSVL